MKIKISKPVSYTAQGNKPNQEDAIYPPDSGLKPETRVFLICDGMGGHENGEVASKCVADTIGHFTKNLPLRSVNEMKEIFKKSLEKAYLKLDDLDRSNAVKKMGTTIVFLSICSDGILTAHIGDSRIYQLRPRRGLVFQTRDHSLINDLIAAGELTEEEAKNHPQRNVITRAIQPHQEYREEASFNVITDIRKGDIFLLCTDGVVERLDNHDLCRILLSDESPDFRIQSLKKECKQLNTNDNNTATLLEITDVEPEEENDTEDSEEQEYEDSEPDRKKRNSRTIFLITLFVAIAGILVFIFIKTNDSSNPSKSKVSPMIENEQVQGIIKRHNR